MDGFGIGEFGSTYAYTVFNERPDPELLERGRESTPCRTTSSRRRPGRATPNHYYFIAGQSGGVIDNPENIETRFVDGKRFKSWGCDAFGDDVFVFAKDDKGNLTKHDTCFSFKTVGQQLSEIGRRLGLLLGGPGPARVLLERLQRHRRRVPHRHVAPAHAAGRRHRERHRGQQAPGRHMGHAQVRALRPPAAVDRARAQLGHRHRERRDEQSDMWEHTAIFLTWDEWGGFYDPVLPPEVDDHRARHPRAAAHDQPVHASAASSTPSSVSSRRRCGSSPTTGGLPYLTPRIANTHTSSTSSTSSRSRRASRSSATQSARPTATRGSSPRATTAGSPAPSPTRPLRLSVAQPSGLPGRTWSAAPASGRSRRPGSRIR